MLQRPLGDIMINRIIESESPDFDPYGFFPATTPEDWEPHKNWLQPNAMDPVTGNLVLTMQSYLVRTSHHTILVDTCVGDHKKRARENWNMTRSGTFSACLQRPGCSLRRWIMSCVRTCMWIMSVGSISKCVTDK
jgi:hypothetical protein